MVAMRKRSQLAAENNAASQRTNYLLGMHNRNTTRDLKQTNPKTQPVTALIVVDGVQIKNC
jgi:hypothetical protein